MPKKKRVALFNWFKDVKFDKNFSARNEFKKRKTNIFIIQDGVVKSTTLCLTLFLVEWYEFV